MVLQRPSTALEHGLEETDLVIVEHGRTLAGCGANGNRVDASFDKALGKLLRARKVKVKILVKGGYACDQSCVRKTAPSCSTPHLYSAFEQSVVRIIQASARVNP